LLNIESNYLQFEIVSSVSPACLFFTWFVDCDGDGFEKENTMGMLEDVLGSALPKGSLAKPLMIAVAALLASGVLTRGFGSGSSSTSSAPAGPGGQSPQGAQADTGAQAQAGGADSGDGGGGLLSGLGGLISKLQQGGLGDVANSWVSTGQNQPITPNQLGTALGPDIISTLAKKTGLSEQDLKTQLSQVLPGIVDKLTPKGRLPTAAELSQQQ
jgi:uncharacterized protein YidB (DUF937 family)